MRRMRMHIHPTRTAVAALLALAVSGCSLVGTGDDESASDAGGGGDEAGGTVVLVGAAIILFGPRG